MYNPENLLDIHARVAVISLTKLIPGDLMNPIVRDDVDLSIQQFSQAWRLMCAGDPRKESSAAR